MPMTRRERLTSIFRGETPDRSAVKLWGAAPGQACRHPALRFLRGRLGLDPVAAAGQHAQRKQADHGPQQSTHRDTSSPLARTVRLQADFSNPAAWLSLL